MRTFSFLTALLRGVYHCATLGVKSLPSPRLLPYLVVREMMALAGLVATVMPVALLV